MAKDTKAEKELQNAYDEAISSERIFEAEGFGKVHIRFPTNKERKLAELEYSKVFTELLDTNLKTKAEMQELLASRGIWTDDDESKIEQLQKQNDKHIEKLAKSQTDKEKDEALNELQNVRNHLTLLHQKRESYMQNTLDAKAEEARIGYLVMLVATNAETNERIWETYEEFINEERRYGQAQIVFQWMTFTNGLPANFLELLPTDGDESDVNGESDGE